jgi:hypothetical protein
VDGLTYLFVAVARSGSDDRKISELVATAIAKAMPDEVALARQRADEWLKKNTTMPSAPGVLTQ